MDSFLMIFGILLLLVLLASTGVIMVAIPRRFAAACEVLAAAGNLPSLLPQSVKGAVFQIRTVGSVCLLAGLVLLRGTGSLMQTLMAYNGIPYTGGLYWLILPAALGLAAGYVVLAYGSEWVTRISRTWLDHPLVPQEMIAALIWELRIAGVAFVLFGLGSGSLWFRALLGR